MGIFIVALICFIVAGILYVSINKDNRMEIENGLIVSDLYATYIGGIPTLEGGRGLHLKVYKDRILLQSNKAIQTSDNIFHKEIPIDDLITAEIKSEQQLQSDVNLKNILMWGVFSIGKVKNTVSNYMVITYKNNSNEQKNLVIQSQKNESIVKSLRKIKFGEID